MQLPAILVAKKQLLQTIGLTSAAFLVALPVGAAVLPHGGQQADAQGTTTTVTRTADDGLGSCTGGTGAVTSAVKRTVTTTTVATPTVNQTGTNDQVGNQNSNNDHGATAQANDHSIAAAVNVGDVLSHNNILSGNNTPVLSGNTVSVPVAAPILSNVGTLLNGLGL